MLKAKQNGISQWQISSCDPQDLS